MPNDTGAKYSSDIDPVPGELIGDYGKAAPEMVTAMIDRAVQQGLTDKVLKLDRVRRAVELRVCT